MTLTVHHIAISNPYFEGRNEVYVVADDPVTIIDTGIATKTGFDALESGLKRHGLSVRDVGRIVLTHKHVDHLGNAWRIQQASGAEIWIHESECDAVIHGNRRGDEITELLTQRFREWQVPERFDRSAFGRMMSQWEIQPAEPRALVDGQRLEFDNGHLEVVHTPGHTVGSVCLRLDQQLFTGDHVLPDVSPNVGGGDLPHRGLLSLFFESLKRIEAQASGIVALPGHGDPFTTLVARCNELSEHHHQRLDHIRLALRNGPLTVYDLAVRLFGTMDDFHVMLGCAEANSHLEWLVDHKEIVASPHEYRYGLV